MSRFFKTQENITAPITQIQAFEELAMRLPEYFFILRSDIIKLPITEAQPEGEGEKVHRLGAEGFPGGRPDLYFSVTGKTWEEVTKNALNQSFALAAREQTAKLREEFPYRIAT